MIFWLRLRQAEIGSELKLYFNLKFFVLSNVAPLQSLIIKTFFNRVGTKTFANYNKNTDVHILALADFCKIKELTLTGALQLHE